MSDVAASAPGKMMVCGEYAVLNGAPAVVAAVQTRATVRWVTEETEHTATEKRYPEAFAARQLAEAALGIEVPGHLEVDVRKLRRGATKLGVGSSAAAAAAAARAVYAWVEHDDADGVMRAAQDGHRKVAPQGSNADVAASVLGGYVAFRRPGGVKDPRFEAATTTLPKGLTLRIAWTGQAASTRELVALVNALREASPAVYDDAMGRLDRLSEEFVAALGSSAEAAVEAAAAYHAAMAKLGDAAGAPIVEERLKKVAALAEQAGGAAKPSGAGGGDVALGFFASVDAAERFSVLCGKAGVEVLELPLGGPGAVAGG